MEFGDIHNVSLRNLWPGEASHFTPWLAKNLDLLGRKLGMDLELEAVEVSAGDFSADIVARDLSTSRLVIIENQYGSTDHKHLGQLITYASVLKASVVVWVAETVRSEHKAAIDFLNQNLQESLSLYVIEASAIRIDDSKPAFVLNVVSMPSEATMRSVVPQPMSETREKYRAFFQGLIDELRERRFTNARAGQPQNWYTFASENSRIFKYSTSFGQGGRVRVEIYLDSGDGDSNEQLFDSLSLSKEKIESELGVQLDWERLENRRACRIALYRAGSIDDDSETLIEIKNWIVEYLLKFRKVFPGYIQKAVDAAA